MNRKISAVILAVSLFMLIANNAFTSLLEQNLDESTLKILLNVGELIHLKEENGKLKQIDYAIIIDAPLAKVWDVLTDFESYPEFIQGQKECKIINKQGNEMTVKSAVEFKFMGIGFTIKYTTNYLIKKPELIIYDTKKIRMINHEKEILSTSNFDSYHNIRL